MQSDHHECNYFRKLVCFEMVTQWILRFLTYFNILCVTRLEKMNSGLLDTYNLLYGAFTLTESDSDSNILSDPIIMQKLLEENMGTVPIKI